MNPAVYDDRNRHAYQTPNPTPEDHFRKRSPINNQNTSSRSSHPLIAPKPHLLHHPSIASPWTKARTAIFAPNRWPNLHWVEGEGMRFGDELSWDGNFRKAILMEERRCTYLLGHDAAMWWISSQERLFSATRDSQYYAKNGRVWSQHDWTAVLVTER
jgi:hypothetical protein